MTRRDFITGGIAAAGAACLASPVRSNMGGYNFSVISRHEVPLDIPYVTDGLVAMYDAIWNAGVGKHREGATTWKNLTGISALDFDISGMIVGDDYIDTNLKTAYTEAILPQTEFTIECVARMSAGIGTWDQANYYLGYGNGLGMPLGFGVTRSWATMLFYGYGNTDDKCNSDAFDVPYADDSFSILRSWSGQCLTDGTRKMYKNGVLLPKRIANARQGEFTPSDNNSLMIGVHMWSTGASTNYKPHFLLSNLRFYDRALTEEEVQWNNAIDSERFSL